MNNSQKVDCLVLFSFLLLLFTGLLSVTFYQKSAAGVSVTITGASTADEDPIQISEDIEKQIGTYSVFPSFSFPEKKDLTEEYDLLQKQIRLFYQTTKECEINNPSQNLEYCIQKTLSEKNYNSWLSESDCETNEERVFYDFTQQILDCSTSKDLDCTCALSFPKNYAPGNYIFQFLLDENNVLLSLQNSPITTTFSSLLLLNNGNTLASEMYTITADENGAKGGFSSLSDTFYLYKKDEKTLSIEDETTFTTKDETKDSCSLAKKTTYKFCVQSNAAVSSYDPLQRKTGTQPLVYVFGIDFFSD